MADEREAWREAFCVLAKGESLLLFIILHTDFSILQYIITTCLVHLLGYEVRQFFFGLHSHNSVLVLVPCDSDTRVQCVATENPCVTVWPLSSVLH